MALDYENIEGDCNCKDVSYEEVGDYNNNPIRVCKKFLKEHDYYHTCMQCEYRTYDESFVKDINGYAICRSCWEDRQP